jgi:hypothetical protein
MSASKPETPSIVIILISADAEWRVIRKLFPGVDYHPSPYGEWFTTTLSDPISTMSTL